MTPARRALGVVGVGLATALGSSVACGGSRARVETAVVAIPPLGDAGTASIATGSPRASDTAAQDARDASVVTRPACERTCRGSLDAAGVDVVAREVKKLRRCYNQALTAAAPDFEARVRARLTLGPDGGVCRVSIEPPTANADFDACLIATLRAGTYPAPTVGCVDVEVPITFKQAAP